MGGGGGDLKQNATPSKYRLGKIPGIMECSGIDTGMARYQRDPFRNHNFADRSLLIPIPRVGTLSDWPFRRGAPLRSPIKFFFGVAPRLNNQSDRVSILGARLNSQLQTVFFPIFHFSPPPSYY
jgi:hypothetical protein